MNPTNNNLIFLGESGVQCSDSWLTEILAFAVAGISLEQDQQKDLAEHLIVCTECRDLALVILDWAKAANIFLKKGRSTRLSRKIGMLESILKELEEAAMQEVAPLYIHILLKQGKRVADEKFPRFASHMTICEDCCSSVIDISGYLESLYDNNIIDGVAM